MFVHLVLILTCCLCLGHARLYKFLEQKGLAPCRFACFVFSLSALSTGGKKNLQFCATDGKKLTLSAKICQLLMEIKSVLFLHLTGFIDLTC